MGNEVTGQTSFVCNWRTDHPGYFASHGAADILPYAFTEMLNNAIDHSEGAVAKIRFWRNSQFWAFDIVDDGVGVFRKISDNFNLAGPIESIGELSKGKRTTAAQGHTGEGIFFTSKVVDRFELSANGLEWDVDNSLSDFTIMYRQMDRGYFQAVLD